MGELKIVKDFEFNGSQCGEDNITQREQYWIDTLSPDLNMTAVADNHWRLSKETIAKRTEKQVKTSWRDSWN